MPQERLDQWLVKEGYFSTLEESQRAIRAGLVRDEKSGLSLEKVGARVSPQLRVKIASPKTYVGRGGDKLASFLQHAELSVVGKVVADIGSSTGGFTDCLLQAGAQKVYCVDVGTHQLHERLRADSRVKVFEQTDARSFSFSTLAPISEIFVVDVSFISLRAIVPHLLAECPRAIFILLFKPQFEVSRFSPKKRGVADQDEAEKSFEEMLQFLRALRLNVRMSRPSAVKGLKGNQETFIMVEAMPSEIFRTYDIRGLADRDLPNDGVYRIGRAFGSILKSRRPDAKVGVGRDERLSSPRIFKSLAHGLSQSGVEVVELGTTTTPQVYFAHYHFNLDAIIQVTASHNPKDDNGMKMMLQKETLFGDEIQRLGREVLNYSEVFDESQAMSKTYPSYADELQVAYADYLIRTIKVSKKYRIAVDCGNGMAGKVARRVFSHYASELEILFEEVDCRFPHHEADPTVVANLKDLQSLMKKKTFDVGFAFDGDGDRLGVLTSSGRILWGDEILMLLSELVLKQKPGSTIIGEVKCSEKLFRMVESRGGQSLMYKTGHSLIKKKMKEVGAPLAGEMSGHLFFADRYFGFDDALYAALRVLEVIDQLGIDLDTWIKNFPESCVTPEIRVRCEESEKALLVEKAKVYFQGVEGARLTLIDGIRVGFPDGAWALVRASNTQAVLVVRVEASSLGRQQEILKEVGKALGRPIDV